MTKPLTHHEILRHVAPFSQAGWSVDLEASDRAQRRIAFSAVSHEGIGEAAAPVIETRVLELDGAAYRLFCTFTEPGGVAATVQVDGDDGERLLAARERAPLSFLFRRAAGHMVGIGYWTRVYRGDAPAPALDAASDEDLRAGWQVTVAEARVDGRAVWLDARPGAGLPAQVTIGPHPDGGEPPLPEDLVAVLGWGWRPMQWRSRAWRATVAVPRREPERRNDVEAKAVALVRHLTEVFAAPPAAFHERFRRARWRAVGRRVMPMATFFGLLGAVALFGVVIPEQMPLWLHGIPPLLAVAALLFSSGEVPLVDWPARPKPLGFTAWHGGDGGAAASAAQAHCSEPPDDS